MSLIEISLYAAALYRSKTKRNELKQFAAIEMRKIAAAMPAKLWEIRHKNPMRARCARTARKDAGAPTATGNSIAAAG